MEDWAEIRRLHRSEGMAVKAIARKMGVSRNTVRAALRAVDPPRYKRASAGSIVDAVEHEIRARLRRPVLGPQLRGGVAGAARPPLSPPGSPRRGHLPSRAPATGWMHASYGLGAVGSPLLVTLLIGNGVSWRCTYVILTLVLAAVACALTLCRIAPCAAAGGGSPLHLDAGSLPCFVEPAIPSWP